MTRARFDAFELDVAERRLRREGKPVELGARYLDALALLVDHAGSLVGKDRFLAEVWRGVPVTDEALTQCIRSLRRVLGDDAARPRFIETVPRHGYRFVAAVEVVEDDASPELRNEPGEKEAAAAIDRHPGLVPGSTAPQEPGSVGTWDGGPRDWPGVTTQESGTRRSSFPRSAPLHRWRPALAVTLAGTLGAGIAGVIGGLFYGSIAAAAPATEVGGASVLLVVLWLTLAAALTGGAGVSAGIAAARSLSHPAWQVAGGAAGGFVVGGVVKLLGIDAFHLLLGRAPDGITGAAEGLALGGTVGVAAWLARGSLRRRIATAALVGAGGGGAILLAGGWLMGGSLAMLAATFPGSRLHLPLDGAAAAATGALEGALFAAAIVGAMTLAQASASASAMSRRDSSTP